MAMSEEDIREIVRNEGDLRWRKIEDCDRISDEVRDNILALTTDVAVVKAILKGILCVAGVVAAFIIPACLKIIMGV